MDNKLFEKIFHNISLNSNDHKIIYTIKVKIGNLLRTLLLQTNAADWTWEKIRIQVKKGNTFFQEQYRKNEAIRRIIDVEWKLPEGYDKQIKGAFATPTSDLSITWRTWWVYINDSFLYKKERYMKHLVNKFENYIKEEKEKDENFSYSWPWPIEVIEYYRKNWILWKAYIPEIWMKDKHFLENAMSNTIHEETHKTFRVKHRWKKSRELLIQSFKPIWKENYKNYYIKRNEIHARINEIRYLLHWEDFRREFELTDRERIISLWKERNDIKEMLSHVKHPELFIETLNQMY